MDQTCLCSYINSIVFVQEESKGSLINMVISLFRVHTAVSVSHKRAKVTRATEVTQGAKTLRTYTCINLVKEELVFHSS